MKIIRTGLKLSLCLALCVKLASFAAASEEISGPLGTLIGNTKNELRQEVNESKNREQMETIGVQDIRLGEYQDGKTLTDIHGNRVRLEQYVLIPKPNQIEILTYSKRDTGVDTLKAVYTLNKDIPKNIETNVPDVRQVGELDPKKWESGALADIQAPEYYSTNIESSVKNDKGDSVVFLAVDGSLYQVNDFSSNLDLYKYDVLYKDSYINVNDITKVRLSQVGGTPGTTTLGTLEWYLPKYLSTTNELSKTVTVDPSKKDGDPAKLIALNDLQTWAHTSSESYWDGTKIDNNSDWWKNMTVGQLLDKKLDWTNKITFADGTYLQQREAWLKDSGEELTVGSYFSLLRNLSPDNWVKNISELNHEGIWTATEFGDRTIDVLWSPSIFVKIATQDVSKNK